MNTPSEVGAAPTRPSLAASLSFLWPGLGHLYARRYRAAALLGVPALMLAAYVLAQLVGGVDLFAVQLLDPSFAIAVVAWTVVVGIWRLLAIGTAWRLGARSARTSSASRTVLALLVVLVVGMHAIVGYIAASFYQAGSIIFEPSPDGTTPPVALGSPSGGPAFSLAPGATPTIAPTPRPSPIGRRSC